MELHREDGWRSGEGCSDDGGDFAEDGYEEEEDEVEEVGVLEAGASNFVQQSYASVWSAVRGVTYQMNSKPLGFSSQLPPFRPTTTSTGHLQQQTISVPGCYACILTKSRTMLSVHSAPWVSCMVD